MSQREQFNTYVKSMNKCNDTEYIIIPTEVTRKLRKCVITTTLIGRPIYPRADIGAWRFATVSKHMRGEAGSERFQGNNPGTWRRYCVGVSRQSATGNCE